MKTYQRAAMTAVVTALLILAACTGGNGRPAESGGDSERLQVVATTTQVGSVAREVGGDAIELTVLLSPGVEAHDYEMTPSDAAAIERADIILLSGAGLEEWLEDVLGATGGRAQLSDLSEGIELRVPAGDEAVHDPHYWLDADNATTMVATARDALSEVDQGNAEAYRERAADLIARLEAADAEITRLMNELPLESRKIVTDHDALGYFIDAYGLTYVGSIFPSLDVSSEPSAADLEALIRTIREEDVVAIFSESAVNPRLARAVADETDAVVVEDPLYTDSMGPDGSGAETLDGMLLHNARVIHAALAGA